MAESLELKTSRQHAPAAFIAPEFVFGLVSGLRDKPIDVDGHLRRVGLDPSALRMPGHPGVTATQYAALFYALLHDARDECLGLFSRPFKPGSFALTARVSMYAPDLGRALKRMSEALNLLQDDISFSLQIHGDEAGLHMLPVDPDSPLAAFAQDTMVRALWRLAAWLVNTPLSIRHFDFLHAQPENQQPYEGVFPATRLYRQSAFGFWFDITHLRAPISRDEPALRAFLNDAYMHVIAPPRNFGPVTQKARNWMIRGYPHWPTLEEVADKLNMAPSTLQRRLAKEGTSLQWLKDDLRRDIAISRLSTSRVSLVQLASELGFSDSPTFQRAFKRWTGQHCGAYRR